MILDSSIETLKTRIDIVDVINGYITLKKAGLNYQACCPFHGEKTPSFVVSFNKQIYHCFGCGVTGDAIKFVQDYERISFGEAVEKLANSVGFALSYDKEKEKISFRSIEAISEYFRASLAKNQFAKDYLFKRGISQESIERFNLGWAPSSRDQIEFARNRHILIPELIEFGVFAQGESGLYSRFSDRLMFPIKNSSGKVIGFGGRTLSNHPAKYINSPQTRFFNKSEVLYGFDIAKDAIGKQKELILCEGYMDVIAYHQSGFHNAVAVLGTALTQKHLPQIKRFDAKVILSFDGDNAGQAAAVKSANLLIQNDILGSAARFDSGFDPADLINKPDEIALKLRQTYSLYELVLRSEIKAFDLSDIAQKDRAAKKVGALLNGFGNVVAGELHELATSLLGVKDLKIKAQKQFFQKTSDVDFKEASIIRAMAESSSLLEYGATHIHAEIFKTYKEAYSALIANDIDNLELMRVLSFENISKIDSVLFYDYVNSLKRDFIAMAAKFLKINAKAGVSAILLREIALNATKNSYIEDDFFDQVLESYNDIKNKV